MAHRPILAALVVALRLAAGPAPAADPLVISMWGGNWKDTVEKVIAKPFTAKTGIPVEFEVGGTLDRLAKARVAKAAPLVDITFTTSHVGRLYMSDGCSRSSTWRDCRTHASWRPRRCAATRTSTCGRTCTRSPTGRIR